MFTGSKNGACDRESRTDHGKGKWRVHTGTHRDKNADNERTTALLEKYGNLLKKTKQARVVQIILSGILPVFDNRIQRYRNSKRMAVNGMVKRLCKEEEVGYVDLWDSFVGKEEMYVRDGLHLSGKGAAVFAEGLSGAVASGLGKVLSLTEILYIFVVLFLTIYGVSFIVRRTSTRECHVQITAPRARPSGFRGQ